MRRMSGKRVTVRLSIKLPWWWRLYVTALGVFHYLGGDVDADIAADFIARRMHVIVTEEA